MADTCSTLRSSNLQIKQSYSQNKRNNSISRTRRIARSHLLPLCASPHKELHLTLLECQHHECKFWGIFAREYPCLHIVPTSDRNKYCLTVYALYGIDYLVLSFLSKWYWDQFCQVRRLQQCIKLTYVPFIVIAYGILLLIGLCVLVIEIHC